MAIAVIDALEMVQVENRHRQVAAVLLPGQHFALYLLAPGRAIGQPGQRVDQCLLPLFLQVFAVAEGLLLHVSDALG
ncbi:hypothetical protein D3C73_1463620 [compost metagenome]